MKMIVALHARPSGCPAAMYVARQNKHLVLCCASIVASKSRSISALLVPISSTPPPPPLLHKNVLSLHAVGDPASDTDAGEPGWR